jgi:hypothetical protein
MNTSIFSTEIAKQHAADLIADAEQNRLAKSLRPSGLLRGRRRSAAHAAKTQAI